MEIKTKFNIGDKVIFRNDTWEIYSISIFPENDGFSYRYVLKNKSRITICNNENLLNKLDVLDKAEKQYLENLLRPFKNRDVEVTKYLNFLTNRYYLLIKVNCEHILLPEFVKNTMYKGMELSKTYTLKELGLFKGEK